jgi:hypothetical protein
MDTRRLNCRCAPGRCGLVVCALLLVGPYRAQAQEGLSNAELLRQRQQVVQQRVERLEGRMLELARILAESKPEKAERLRDTLDQVGHRQVRSKLQRLTELLADEKLSEADRFQAEVLDDLSALLALLVSPLNELDRLREERKRLEELKRKISALIDQQQRVLYQTERAAEGRERPSGAQEPRAPGNPTEDAAGQELRQRIRRLQELQHDLQRRAAGLRGEFKSDSSDPTPGRESMEQARGAMQQAADELGEDRPGSAQKPQREAIDQMQRTVDELERSLRQMRQEEREETLAALETRLQGIVSKERRVRESMDPLLAVAAAQWARLEQLQLAEANELHGEALDQARLTLRILVDEGTTVVVPELMRQVVADMDRVAQRFSQARVDHTVAQQLDGVIQQIEEILGAVEQQRDDDAEPGQSGGDGGSERPKALLSRSAELKLLRGAQLRINDATAALDAGRAAGDGPSAEYWAQRQQQLLEQARRMAENE